MTTHPARTETRTMTVRTANGAPPGMPAHLWEAAKRDVRGVIPDWLRSAKENGADAPPHIREVARRAARAGAGLGMAITIGGGAHAVASSGATAVVPVAHATASGPDGAALPGAALAPEHLAAEAFRIADPQQGLLTVEMYQDVVVNEAAAAGYDVDAFQYLVISDDGGRSYVFKEHHHAALSEPPARETDLLIHERGQVHVTENPDGSFSMDTVGYDRSVRGPDDQPVDGGAPEHDGAAWLDDPRPDDPAPDPVLHAVPDPVLHGVADPTPPVAGTVLVAPDLDAADPMPVTGHETPSGNDIPDITPEPPGPDLDTAPGTTHTPDDPFAEQDPSPDAGPLLV